MASNVDVRRAEVENAACPCESPVATAGPGQAAIYQPEPSRSMCCCLTWLFICPLPCTDPQPRDDLLFCCRWQRGSDKHS